LTAAVFLDGLETDAVELDASFMDLDRGFEVFFEMIFFCVGTASVSNRLPSNGTRDKKSDAAVEPSECWSFDVVVVVVDGGARRFIEG
jgi:hypothetical protein